MDRPPYGLGWKIADTTHVSEALGVALPRGEMAARERYFKALRAGKPTATTREGQSEDKMLALV